MEVEYATAGTTGRWDRRCGTFGGIVFSVILLLAGHRRWFQEGSFRIYFSVIIAYSLIRQIGKYYYLIGKPNSRARFGTHLRYHSRRCLGNETAYAKHIFFIRFSYCRSVSTCRLSLVNYIDQMIGRHLEWHYKLTPQYRFLQRTIPNIQASAWGGK